MRLHEHSSRRGRPGRGMRRRGPGGRRAPEPPVTTSDELSAWFTGALPDDWFTGPIDIAFDRDEIIVTGTLHAPELGDNTETDVAEEARITAFREDTRQGRVSVAERAQQQFERHVTWAVRCGNTEAVFTAANVPVMTRLRFDDRQVLDTLIAAGVARSRADALSWCVRLVGENESEWIDEIQDAMKAVEEARAKGPSTRRD